MLSPDFFFLPFAWNTFSIPLLSVCVCIQIWNTSLVGSICMSSCFCIHSATLYLLVEAFSPFKFKVIIDKCVFIATLLTILGLFCSFCVSFCFPFLFFEIWWLYLILCLDSFLFLYLCIYFRFLVCDYNVTHITVYKYNKYICDYFNQWCFLVWMDSKDPALSLHVRFNVFDITITFLICVSLDYLL